MVTEETVRASIREYNDPEMWTDMAAGREYTRRDLMKMAADPVYQSAQRPAGWLTESEIDRLLAEEWPVTSG